MPLKMRRPQRGALLGPLAIQSVPSGGNNRTPLQRSRRNVVPRSVWPADSYKGAGPIKAPRPGRYRLRLACAATGGYVEERLNELPAVQTAYVSVMGDSSIGSM
jgi:hypothetical protein